MNNLTTYNRLRNGLITAQDFKITSLEIAEMTGQKHYHTLERIRERLTPQQYGVVKYLDKKEVSAQYALTYYKEKIRRGVVLPVLLGI